MTEAKVSEKIYNDNTTNKDHRQTLEAFIERGKLKMGV